MCPFCLAAVGATCAVILAFSVVLLALRDVTAVSQGIILGGTAICQKLDETIFLPIEWYFVVSLLLIGRVIYLAFAKREALLVVHAWHRAKHLLDRRRDRKETQASCCCSSKQVEVQKTF